MNMAVLLFCAGRSVVDWHTFCTFFCWLVNLWHVCYKTDYWSVLHSITLPLAHCHRIYDKSPSLTPFIHNNLIIGTVRNESHIMFTRTKRDSFSNLGWKSLFVLHKKQMKSLESIQRKSIFWTLFWFSFVSNLSSQVTLQPHCFQKYHFLNTENSFMLGSE